MNRRSRAAAALPGALLVLVAALQIALAHLSPLSPWKGGGFGMFASLDGGSFRSVRAFVEAEGRWEELEPDPALGKILARAELFPSDRLTTRLARDIAREERELGLPVDAVRIQVWRVEFAPGSLAPTRRLLRERTVVVPPDW